MAGTRSLPDYTSCCDSVSLCFSKGLGAPVGRILVGSKSFVKHARWVRKSIGGGVRQSGVLTAAARVALDETFGKDLHGKDSLLKRSHLLARRLADFWESLGGKMEKKTETNMVWLDLEDVHIDEEVFSKIGRENGLRIASRLVLYYQISDEAISRLEDVMRLVVAGKGSNGRSEVTVGHRTYGTKLK